MSAVVADQVGGRHHRVIADDGTVLGTIKRTDRGTFRAVAILGLERSQVPLGEHPFINAAHYAIDQAIEMEPGSA